MYWSILCKKSSGFDLKYFIDYKEFRADFSYFPLTNHTITFGTNVIKYKLNPGSIFPSGSHSIISKEVLEDENGIESAVYINNEINEMPAINASIKNTASSYPKNELNILWIKAFNTNNPNKMYVNFISDFIILFYQLLNS